MDWNRMRDQIGWALTGVESYEHRQARLSEETPEQMHAAGPHCCDCDAVKYGYIHCCADHDPSRAILLDLIAELREAHPVENGYCLPCTHWGAVNPWNPNESNNDDDRCPSLQAADRAEARLREVSE